MVYGTRTFNTGVSSSFQPIFCPTDGVQHTGNIVSENEIFQSITNSKRFYDSQRSTSSESDDVFITDISITTRSSSSGESNEDLPWDFSVIGESSEDHLWDEINEAMQVERVKMENQMRKEDRYVPSSTATGLFCKKNMPSKKAFTSSNIECSSNISSKNKVNEELYRSNVNALPNDEFYKQSMIKCEEKESQSYNVPMRKAFTDQIDDTTKNGICKDYSRYKFCLRGLKCSHKHLSYEGRHTESITNSWMLIDSEEKMRKIRRMLADKMFCRNYLKKRLCADGTTSCLGLHCAQSDAERFRITGDLPDHIWMQAADKWARNNKITWYARLPELFGGSSICIAHIRGSLFDGTTTMKVGCERSGTRACNYRHVNVDTFAHELGSYLRSARTSRPPTTQFPDIFSSIPPASNIKTSMAYPYPPPQPQPPMIPTFAPVIIPQGWMAVPYLVPKVHTVPMYTVAHNNVLYTVIG